MRELLMVLLALSMLGFGLSCGSKEEVPEKVEVTEKTGTQEKAKDLVCGMEIASEGAVKTEYEGRTYYFCSVACKDAFEKEPEKWAEEDEN